jgi:hypothetical protein
MHIKESIPEGPPDGLLPGHVGTAAGRRADRIPVRKRSLFFQHIDRCGRRGRHFLLEKRELAFVANSSAVVAQVNHGSSAGHSPGSSGPGDRGPVWIFMLPGKGGGLSTK